VAWRDPSTIGLGWRHDLPVSADDRGELDRAGHLGPDPLRARGRGLGQPPARDVADGQEPGLGLGPRPGPGLARPVPAGMMRVVLSQDLGLPGTDSRCRAVSAAPRPVRAVITSSSPATRHHTRVPAWPGGVE
jgi:hypothetical protein